MDTQKVWYTPERAAFEQLNTWMPEFGAILHNTVIPDIRATQGRCMLDYGPGNEDTTNVFGVIWLLANDTHRSPGEYDWQALDFDAEEAVVDGLDQVRFHGDMLAACDFLERASHEYQDGAYETEAERNAAMAINKFSDVSTDVAGEFLGHVREVVRQTRDLLQFWTEADLPSDYVPPNLYPFAMSLEDTISKMEEWENFEWERYRALEKLRRRDEPTPEPLPVWE